MRNHAVMALIGRAGRDHDHFAFGLAQAAVLFHQRVVVGKERAKLVRPIGQREKHIRHEARFFLHTENTRTDVVGQVFQCGNGKTADGGCCHDGVQCRQQKCLQGP